MSGSRPNSPASSGRLWARYALDPLLGVVSGLLVEWQHGVFSRIERTPAPPADLPPETVFGQHLLTPGFLNAHAHLDYSFLRGALPRGQGFVPWLEAIIQARRNFTPETEPQAREDCRRAIHEMIRDGVTEVWDISSLGWARQDLRGSALHAISFEEWISPRREGWQPRWERWRSDFEEQRLAAMEETPGQLTLGLSAHTPYTVCPPALQASAEWARRRGLPLAIHLAESPEENELLIHGRGKLRDLFISGRSGTDPAEEYGTGASPIARAQAAGLLSPSTLAIHCNLPLPEEAGLLAETRTPVVFCPRSHAFFGYPTYPLEDYFSAGVHLALGTDGLTSNDSLSIRQEARALAALSPSLTPLEVLACATGALLGEHPPFGGRGRLAQSQPAQWAIWPLENPPARPTPETLLDFLLIESTPLARSSATAP